MGDTRKVQVLAQNTHLKQIESLQSKPLKSLSVEASGKMEGKVAQLFSYKQSSNFPFSRPANVPFKYLILREEGWEGQWPS